MNFVTPARFFDIEENVKEYIEMREGLDGRFLINILRRKLNPNATILELGMGPGKDLDILNEYFDAAGSDVSQVFVDLYRHKEPTADVLVLDAVSLKTDRKFDCLYSNKVLHHLSREDLKRSFKRQSEILNDNGILFHTFWEGDGETEFQDLHFNKYEIAELEKVLQPYFELLESESYAELNLNDSFYVLLRKR